jgi:glycosyltransferase involved in cell wall biosynthesis
VPVPVAGPGSSTGSEPQSLLVARRTLRHFCAVRVSVVVPVYRGGATVPELVRQLGEVLRPSYDLEVVLVDDASPDDSAEVCRGIAGRESWVRLLCLSRNFGEHNAVMAGLNHATGDAVVVMDDDLQNPPAEVPKLLEKLREGHDVVYARYERKRHEMFRNFVSWVNDRFANVMLGKPPNLYLCSFKVMNRFLVDEVTKYDGPFPYVDGLILRVTRRIGVVTVEHQGRKVGRSGYTLGRLFVLWVNMLTGFSILPLRVASVLGLTVAGLGALGAIAFAVERAVNSRLPVGWASLAVAIMVLAGTQLFTLGILGEYLGRLSLRVGGEPQYVVRSSVNLATSAATDTRPLQDKGAVQASGEPS